MHTAAAWVLIIGRSVAPRFHLRRRDRYYHHKGRRETSWTKPPGFGGGGGAGGASGWSTHTDKKGRTYYHHRERAETSWTKPPGFQGDGQVTKKSSLKGMLSKKKQNPRQMVRGESMTDTFRIGDGSATTAPGSPSPGKVSRSAGGTGGRSGTVWEKHEDKKTGSPYWFHRHKRTTTWFDPHQWEHHTNDDGKSYYHHPDKGTQWQKPDHIDHLHR